jgi:hypothetical protein
VTLNLVIKALKTFVRYLFATLLSQIVDSFSLSFMTKGFTAIA